MAGYAHGPGGDERPYTLDQLFRDLGEETAGRDAKENDEPDVWPENDEDTWPTTGMLVPPPDADRTTGEEIHRAHVRLCLELEKMSERAGDEPHRRWAAVAALAEASELLRANTSGLFEDDISNRPLTDEVAEALRSHGQRLYVMQLAIEDFGVPQSVDEFSALVESASRGITVRACAEAMRALRQAANESRGDGREEARQEAILELHAHATLEMECGNGNHIDHYDESDRPAVVGAWTECWKIHEAVIDEYNARITRTVLSDTMQGLNERDRKDIETRQVEPTRLLVGIARGTTQARHGLLCRRRREAIPYMIFAHRGTRYVQAIGDAPPEDVEDARYVTQLRACSKLMGEVGADPRETQQAELKVRCALEDAQAGVSRVSDQGRRTLGAWVKRHRIPPGDAEDLMIGAIGHDCEAADRLLTDMGVMRPKARRRAAKRVIDEAKRRGIDGRMQAEIAQAMGWDDPERLGVNLYRPTEAAIRDGERMARRAGLPGHIVERLKQRLEEWRHGH